MMAGITEIDHVLFLVALEKKYHKNMKTTVRMIVKYLKQAMVLP